MSAKLNCIMIIDDDEPTNFISSLVLEEVNCAEQVLVFENAEKALNHIRRNLIAGNLSQVPQLIFLDINMPRMNGWEFMEAFSQLVAEQQPVIIMLTTSQNPEDKLRAQQISAIASFETKPITPELVHTILETHFHLPTTELPAKLSRTEGSHSHPKSKTSI